MVLLIVETSDFGQENSRCNSLLTLEDDICESHEVEAADTHTTKPKMRKKKDCDPAAFLLNITASKRSRTKARPRHWKMFGQLCCVILWAHTDLLLLLIFPLSSPVLMG